MIIETGGRVIKSNHRVERGAWQRNVERIWGKPLEHLDELIQLSFELGSDFNRRKAAEAERNHDLVFPVLVRLHGRGIRVAREIVVLMRAGYAAGAFSRWRTLHEILVAAYFVEKNGDEAAERFILHDTVESWKAIQVHQKHCERLAHEPYSIREVASVQRATNDLIGRFGKGFMSDYGWAEKFLPKGGKVTLSRLEDDVALGHWRPYYKMASHDIHAGPRGSSHTMGLGRSQTGGIILAGPTTGGMADPGQCTAISLTNLTACLLSSMPPTPTGIMYNSLMIKLEKMTCSEFAAAHEEQVRNSRSGRRLTWRPGRTLLGTALGDESFTAFAHCSLSAQSQRHLREGQ